MAKLNVLLIAVVVISLLVAFDPQARVQTLDVWDTFRPVLMHIKEGLTAIFHEITNNTSDVPSDEDKPPVNDGPVYHADLCELSV